MEYNKLVRDNIPAIIEVQGETPVTRVLDGEEYLLQLEKKLDEEVAEFHGSGDPEELADILEVVYALGEAKGLSLYQATHDARGGFAQRIFLISKQP